MADRSTAPRALVYGPCPDELRRTETLLAELGIAVTLAADPRVALALAVALTPDLVIVQAAGPGDDCRGLSRDLREHPATSAIPVLLVDTRDGAADEALGSSDASLVVTRPYEHGRLAETVRAALHVRQPLGREIPDGCHDPLTGLWQHEFLVKRFVADRAEGHRDSFCHVLVELDGFPLLRAGRGDVFADAVLRAVARTLSERARRTDLLARAGDGLFSLILTRTEVSLGAEAALRLRRQIVFGALQAPEGADLGVELGVSVGVACSGEALEWEEVSRRAQIALAAAREEGGNCVYFWSHDRPARATDEQIVVPAEWR